MTLEDATRVLAEAQVENPRAEARLLLAHAMGVGRDATLTMVPTPEQAARFAGLIARRAAHEPFAYITGRREFWSLDLEVGPGVLVPRPDTETLIEQAQRLFPDPQAPLRIADLGTGSGAILLAALAAFPRATGIGFETSLAAHGYAVRNAARHGGGRADIRLADWNSAPESEKAPFDLVFSNPPYIPAGDIPGLDPEVASHEPHLALDGGPDGLDAYRALARLLPGLLAPGGVALLEIGQGQGPALEPLFPGLEFAGIAPDLAGVPRCLTLRKPQDFLGKPRPFR